MEIEIFNAASGRFDINDESNIHCHALPEDDSYFRVIRTLEFNSEVQRMSVIAKNSHDDQHYIFCKGNPEIIRHLCLKETIPKGFSSHLKTLTSSGYRVLAVGTKKLSDEETQLDRESLENHFEFKGLLVLENKLKPRTAEVIDRLDLAQIFTVMITGDNIFTATSVALQCGILVGDSRIYEVCIVQEEIKWKILSDLTYIKEKSLRNSLLLNKLSSNKSNDSLYETMLDNDLSVPRGCNLSIQGATLEKILSKFCPDGDLRAGSKNLEIRNILRQCRVYARTTPQQKRIIVELLKYFKEDEDTLVGFCGDGANDTLALKEADVGISLSKEEASLAAPFVSNDFEITSCENVLKEGRASLACNFQNFKYFIFYCLTQALGCVVLFFYLVDFSNLAYIWMDIVIALPLTAFLAQISTGKYLGVRLPENSLLKIDTLLSYFVLLAVCFCLLIVSMNLIKNDPNYQTPTAIRIEAGLDPQHLDQYDSNNLLYFEPAVRIILIEDCISAVFSDKHRRMFCFYSIFKV